MRNLFLFFLAWSATCMHLQAQEDPPPSKKSFERDVAVELLPAGSGEPLHAVIELGKLPVGSQIALNLVLKNTSDQEFRFSGVSKKCSCSQFKPEKYQIPAKESIKAKLTLKIPARGKEVAGVNTVSLVDQGTVVANIDLKFELEGLLAFRELMTQLVFESDEPTQSIQIPFLATPPVQLDRIQVRASDNLAGVEIEITLAEDGGMIQLVAPSKLLDDGDVQGEILLSHPEMDRADCMWLIVKDARQSEISPKIILFRHTKTGWVAKAVVRLAPSLLTTSKKSSDKQSSENPIQFSCAFEDTPLELETKELGGGVFQIECSMDSALVDRIANVATDSTAEKNFLYWKISNGRTASKLKTPFVIEAK